VGRAAPYCSCRCRWKPGYVGGQPAPRAARVISGTGAVIKLREEAETKGITTDASIWLTTAIGMGASMGRETTATVSFLPALRLLSALKRLVGGDTRSGRPLVAARFGARICDSAYISACPFFLCA
jgi:hypothetical protein